MVFVLRLGEVWLMPFRLDFERLLPVFPKKMGCGSFPSPQDFSARTACLSSALFILLRPSMPSSLAAS